MPASVGILITSAPRLPTSEQNIVLAFPNDPGYLINGSGHQSSERKVIY